MAFSYKKIFGFDEDCYQENVHVLFQHDKCNLYEKDLSFNISPTYYNLFREYYDYKSHLWKKQPLKTNLLIWNGKDILGFCKNKGHIIETSYLYAHLHMRKMNNTLFPSPNCFVKLCPENFEPVSSIPNQLAEWDKEKKIYLSVEILKRFLRERYYIVKSLGKSVKSINPYNDFG